MRLLFVSGLFVGTLAGCGDVRDTSSQSWDCMLYGRTCQEYEKRDLSRTDGKDGSDGQDGKDGTDGASGRDGIDGLAGPAGERGMSCSVESTSTGAVIRCEDGTEAYVQNGTNGTNGTNGSNGTNGTNGRDGSSCSASRVSNGVLISCTDGTQSVVLDGEDGANGQNGQDAQISAHTIVEVYDVCGNQAGALDEVLLRTKSGKWIAHYSSGSLQFLTILEPGSYRTTDSTRCAFTVNSSNQIVNEYNY